ncbi:hypothetical protein SLA2020_397380 [Shorea laevis]
MNLTSTQLVTSRRMGIYDPSFQHINMWDDTFKGDNSPNKGALTILQIDARLDNKSEFISHESGGPSSTDQEENKPADKVQRRLAQNREAARKSRLRKKAYVHQLESSRLKLAQLELELERTRKQGVYSGSALDTSHVGFSGNVNSGIAAFEMEYAHWVEEQQKQIFELRNALQAHVSEIELNILVENGLNHYYNLFRMKADAAKADVFYLLSGAWRTSTERFFLWIGGFRPSELLMRIAYLEKLIPTFTLWKRRNEDYHAGSCPCSRKNGCKQKFPYSSTCNLHNFTSLKLLHDNLKALPSIAFRTSWMLVVLPQLEPLTDQQVLRVYDLRRSSQQAEDALSQGMDKLQQSLSQGIGVQSVNAGNYGSQMAAAMEKLEALEGFVNQADHLRQQTLQQMSRILTTHQFALAARPREPA